MALPPLADVSDLGVRLGVTLAGPDAARAGAALDDASALIREATGLAWSADGTTLDSSLPPAVVTIALAVARRVYENPSGFASETIGSYSYTRSRAEQSGLYLTDEERRALRRIVGARSFDSLELVRSGSSGTTWVSTQDVYADPIPFEVAPATYPN